MKQITICIIVLLLIIALSCNKNNKNTDTAYFSCYINGQYFEPEKQQGLGEYPVTAKLLFNDTLLAIDVAKDIQVISLSLLDINGIGANTYKLEKNILNVYNSYADYDDNISVDKYSTDSSNIGYATISKLDKNNMVVEGTFYFTAFNSTRNKKANITNGKFKLKYTLH